MSDVWLRTNRRIFVVAMVFAAALASAGGALTWIAKLHAWDTNYCGRAFFLLASAGAAISIRGICRPRLAFRDGHLLAYVKFGRPYVLPIGAVECFFIGQADTNIPVQQVVKTAIVTIVVRLAESARDWHQQKTIPSIASWQCGYIIIRGTWSEPIDVHVVNRLNRKLREAQRAMATTDRIETHP